MDELDGFSEIARLSKELTSIPADIDVNYFYKKLNENSYLQARDEIYHAPLIRQMLAREARATLQKNRPQLKRIITKEPTKDCRYNLQCTTYPGHFGLPPPPKPDELQQAVNLYFGQTCKLIGDFLYPRGGYREWHTNRYEGEHWSMFLIHVDEPEKSFFRFLHPDTNEMITIWDYANSVNFFRTGSNPPLWHCIASEETNRWSKGFLVPEAWLSYI